MFGFFKKKPIVIVSISNGKIVELEDVKDEVFSQKLAGDGVAIIPLDGTIVAPVDGVISRIFPTNHAFSMTTKDNLEVLVHIGLDTVELKGKGFTVLEKEGNRVKANTPIIDVDLEYLKSQGKDTITPILVNSEKDITINSKNIGVVKRGDSIFEVSF